MERPSPMMSDHPSNLQNGQFHENVQLPGGPSLGPGGSKSNMSDYINAALRQIEQTIGDRDPNLPPGVNPPGPPGMGGPPGLPPHGMPPGMMPHWDQHGAPFFPGGPQMMPEMVQFDETSPHHPAFIGFDGLRPPPPGLMDGPMGPFGHFPPGSDPGLISGPMGGLPPMSAPQHLPPVSGNESRPFDQGHPQIPVHPHGHVMVGGTQNGQNGPAGVVSSTTFNHSPDGSRCSISPRDSGYDSCEVVKHECWAVDTFFVQYASFLHGE